MCSNNKKLILVFAFFLIGHNGACTTGRDLRNTSAGSESSITVTAKTIRDISIGEDFIFVIGKGGILRKYRASENQVSEVVPTTAAVYQTFFLDEKTGWTVGEQHEVSMTEDGGKSWQRMGVIADDVPHIEGVGQLFFVNKEIGWFRDMWAVWKTVDGGVAWNVVYPTDSMSYQTLQAQPMNLFVVDENIVWLGMYNSKVLLSVDGGRSWKLLETPMPTEVAAMSCSEKSCWMIRRGDGGLYHFDDSGKMRKQEVDGSSSRNVTIKSISFANLKVGFVAGYERASNTEMKPEAVVLRTSDGGLSWQKLTGVPSEPNFSLVSFKTEKSGWLVGGALGDSSAIHHTSDGGITWRKIVDMK